MKPQYATPTRIALTVAVFLSTLVLVAWRQSHAFAVMTEIEEVTAEIAQATSERDALRQEIRYLESLERIVADAGDRLGMHIPSASEQRPLGGPVQ